MNTILLYLWCLPQNLLGLLVKNITKARKINDMLLGEYYEYDLKWGSVSLGEYIFLCPQHYGLKHVLTHELGHRHQSRMLGWFYIPVIGLPSIVWAGCFKWYRSMFGVDYYDFYTEKWADKIAGINRR